MHSTFHSHCDALVAPTAVMQIALFGTSADPPTIAHYEIVNWLATQFAGVAVWAADNPFKVHGASLEQRSQMLELLIAELDPPLRERVKVYPELSSRRTIESLFVAQTIWQNANFVLVIGADLIAQLPSWYRAAELFAQVQLLIVPRNGNDIDPTKLDLLKNLGAKITIAPLATPAISSTIVRTTSSHRLAVDSSASSLGLTPAVARYIQARALYREQ